MIDHEAFTCGVKLCKKHTERSIEGFFKHLKEFHGLAFEWQMNGRVNTLVVFLSLSLPNCAYFQPFGVITEQRGRLGVKVDDTEIQLLCAALN